MPKKKLIKEKELKAIKSDQESIGNKGNMTNRDCFDLENW